MKITKTMTLYHGSPYQFDQFEVRNNNNVCIEGDGVYFSDNKDLASNYGANLYQVKINEDDIEDFTDLNNITHFMKDVLNDVAAKFEMTLEELYEVIQMDYIGQNLMKLYKQACESHISVSDVYEHALNELENHESTYMSIEESIGMEDFSEAFEASFKDKLKPVIKYYDKQFETNIYIAKDADKLKKSIVELYREKLG